MSSVIRITGSPKRDRLCMRRSDKPAECRYAMWLGNNVTHLAVLKRVQYATQYLQKLMQNVLFCYLHIDCVRTQDIFINCVMGTTLPPRGHGRGSRSSKRMGPYRWWGQGRLDMCEILEVGTPLRTNKTVGKLADGWRDKKDNWQQFHALYTLGLPCVLVDLFWRLARNMQISRGKYVILIGGELAQITHRVQ